MIKSGKTIRKQVNRYRSRVQKGKLPRTKRCTGYYLATLAIGEVDFTEEDNLLSLEVETHIYGWYPTMEEAFRVGKLLTDRLDPKDKIYIKATPGEEYRADFPCGYEAMVQKYYQAIINFFKEGEE